MIPFHRSVGSLICLLLSALCLACGTFNVRSDWDPDADFLAMRSFQYAEPPKLDGADSFAENSLIRKRIRNAVETVLAERGYREAGESEAPDFLITYSILLEDEYKVRGSSSTFGTDFGRRGRRAGIDSYSGKASPRQESTLLLDVNDPSTGDLFWRGWGVGIVQTRDRARSEERLLEGVRAILARFPPERDGVDR